MNYLKSFNKALKKIIFSRFLIVIMLLSTQCDKVSTIGKVKLVNDECYQYETLSDIEKYNDELKILREN